jgi:hypothetical protein
MSTNGDVWVKNGILYFSVYSFFNGYVWIENSISTVLTSTEIIFPWINSLIYRSRCLFYVQDQTNVLLTVLIRLMDVYKSLKRTKQIDTNRIWSEEKEKTIFMLIRKKDNIIFILCENVWDRTSLYSLVSLKKLILSQSFRS